MYIPPYYQEDDQDKLVAFMEAHSFATIVSHSGSSPVATHLPFYLEKRADKLFLVSHMAKANPQWQSFGDNETLTIFQGPNAYISPVHYEKKQNVPTWNYIAVHAYGKVKLLQTDAELIPLLEKTIAVFENDFYKQWKELSPDYVSGMLKAIVGFEIEVLRLEGKFKLSQNKTRTEQVNIISSLEKSGDSVQEELAHEMKKKL